MRLVSFLLADAANSTNDGKLNVLGAGITRLTPPKIPFTLPQLVIIASFLLDSVDEKIELTVGVRNPDQAYLVGPQKFPIEPQGVETIHEEEEVLGNFFLTLGAMPIRSEGIYRFELSLNGELVRDAALVVRAMPQA